MMGFSFGGFDVIYMLIFWVVIVGLAAWLLSGLFPKGTDDASSHTTTRWNDTTESPLEILQRRYIRGEISKTEYEEMFRDLSG